MSKVTDAAGKEIRHVSFDLNPGETSAVIALLLVPDAGDIFKSSADVDVRVEARRTGTADPWADLAAGGIDMSLHTPGAAVGYDIRAVAGAYSSAETRRFVMFVGLTKRRAAGWDD